MRRRGRARHYVLLGLLTAGGMPTFCNNIAHNIYLTSLSKNIATVRRRVWTFQLVCAGCCRSHLLLQNHTRLDVIIHREHGKTRVEKTKTMPRLS
jgi:hypothetical protein